MIATRKIVRLTVTAILGVSVLPIITLNIETLAVRKHWDLLLSDRWDTIMSSLSSLAQAPWFLVFVGTALGATIFMWADYIIRRWPDISGFGRITRVLQETTTARAADDAQSATAIAIPGLLASWRALIDSVEEKYNEKKRLTLEPLLRQNQDYYRLERYLSLETIEAVKRASAAIRIEPVMRLGGEETTEQRAIRMLRQEIARIEHDALMPPEQLARKRTAEKAVRRQLIEEFYFMLDGIEQNMPDEKCIAPRIRVRREYCRLEPYLSEVSKLVIYDAPVQGFADAGETDNAAIMRQLRQNAAQLEKDWRIV